MVEFSVFPALAGGALIGAGAVVLMLGLGRVMGIAGMVGGLLRQPSSADTGWRLAFLAGLATPALIALALGRVLPVPQGGWALVLLAGLLVGFGARMGNGCTSGHGICGLARLSPRSAAAVGVFMATAAVTVAVMRHGLGG